MTADGPRQDWADAVVAFLSANIPREDEEPARSRAVGWNHGFVTAWQIGCMALIAPGEAMEEVWGATPRNPPARPARLPRWDDVAVVVLSLANQQNHLAWLKPDGSTRRSRGAGVIHPAVQPPPPNIVGLGTCHPARVSVDAMQALSALSLIRDGAWTDAAELVLWRCGQDACSTDIETDPRFVTARATCISTIPPDVRADLARLSELSEADVAADMANRKMQDAERSRRYPRLAPARHPTEEGVRRSLVLLRGNEADWLFFRRWRLPDGWLSPREIPRALEVFHDPVAHAMRRAVIAKLFPRSDLALAEAPRKTPP